MQLNKNNNNYYVELHGLQRRYIKRSTIDNMDQYIGNSSNAHNIAS